MLVICSPSVSVLCLFLLLLFNCYYYSIVITILLLFLFDCYSYSIVITFLRSLDLFMLQRTRVRSKSKFLHACDFFSWHAFITFLHFRMSALSLLSMCSSQIADSTCQSLSSMSMYPDKIFSSACQCILYRACVHSNFFHFHMSPFSSSDTHSYQIFISTCRHFLC